VFDISGWEFLTLAALAVILFGPDRLPKLAADAGRIIRAIRMYVHDAKSDLARELGPEITDLKMPDLKMSDLTPRGILRKSIGDDPFADLRAEMDSLRAPLSDPVFRPLAVNEVPPIDSDAT
jgi:sec-independent protein translocase protein TatB